MNIISKQESLNLLNWASDLNPGAWKQHSLNVARAARTIAEHCNLDSDLAYNMGLLHDIGRYE